VTKRWMRAGSILKSLSLRSFSPIPSFPSGKLDPKLPVHPKLYSSSAGPRFQLMVLDRARDPECMVSPGIGFKEGEHLTWGSVASPRTLPTETRFPKVSSITSRYSVLCVGPKSPHSSWLKSTATSRKVTGSCNVTRVCVYV
jgi:hypothetical protein